MNEREVLQPTGKQTKVTKTERIFYGHYPPLNKTN